MMAIEPRHPESKRIPSSLSLTLAGAFPGFSPPATAARFLAAKEAGRPIEYLPSPKTRKDEYARNIALEDDIQDGLICVLTCVKPRKTYEIHRNREKKASH